MLRVPCSVHRAPSSVPTVSSRYEQYFWLGTVIAVTEPPRCPLLRPNHHHHLPQSALDDITADEGTYLLDSTKHIYPSLDHNGCPLRGTVPLRHLPDRESRRHGILFMTATSRPTNGLDSSSASRALVCPRSDTCRTVESVEDTRSINGTSRVRAIYPRPKAINWQPSTQFAQRDKGTTGEGLDLMGISTTPTTFCSRRETNAAGSNYQNRPESANEMLPQ